MDVSRNRAEMDHRAEPRYQVIYSLLREEIRDKYEDGDMLPSEKELAAIFSASRTTIRHALDLLVQEGRIVRVPGRGTVVAAQEKLAQITGLEGMTKALSGQGQPVAIFNRVEALETVAAPEPLAERLGIPGGAQVLRLERLRLLGGQPLSLDESFLIPEIGDRLAALDLAHHDIFSLLEDRLSSPIGRVKVAIAAAGADPYAAAALDVPEGSPLLRLERVAWSRGRPILAENVLFRHERFQFVATIERTT